jgi:hypothetical protein
VLGIKLPPAIRPAFPCFEPESSYDRPSFATDRPSNPVLADANFSRPLPQAIPTELPSAANQRNGNDDLIDFTQHGPPNTTNQPKLPRPVFAMNVQTSSTPDLPTQQVSRKHRKARSHDVTSKQHTGSSPTIPALPRRRSFNYSLLTNGHLDALDEEQPGISSPTTGTSHKSRPSLTVFERADLLLNRAKRRT